MGNNLLYCRVNVIELNEKRLIMHEVIGSGSATVPHGFDKKYITQTIYVKK